MSKLSKSLLPVDLRTDSTFAVSIAPAKGNKIKIAYLIVKDQVLWPLLQGFGWALARDWYQVAAAFAKLHGSEIGQNFQAWLSGWLASPSFRTYGAPAAAP